MINWEEAPEGTTHALWNKPHEPGWCKIEIDVVYYYNEDEEWEALEYDPDEWLEKFEAIIHERPKVPPPVEAELPDGKVWPEGADFYYWPADAFFRFDEPAYKFGHVDRWSKFPLVSVQEYAGRPESIHRWVGAQPKAAPKEEPPKKRAVGWWT